MQKWSVALRINSVAIAEALAPLHILRRPRWCGSGFGYKGDGLNVAFVRIFEISPVWALQNEKAIRWLPFLD